MDLPDHWIMFCGLGAAALAVYAWVADRRRIKRADFDRVGFMPWTGLFFVSLIAAVMLLGAALKTG